MDKLYQMRAAVQSDLSVDGNSTIYNPTDIDLALNRALRIIAGMHEWAETEDAKKTSTKATYEYYDYPDTWRPDTIWKVEVDGVDLGNPLNFADYLYEKGNDFPAGNKTIWSNQWRRFFILIDGLPPTANGVDNISLWGHKVVDLMVGDNDTTIFSFSLPEINDAIVMEAKEIMKSKDSERSSQLPLKSQQAFAIVEGQWEKLKKRQAKYQKTRPMFRIPNFFGRNGSSSRDF